MIDKYAHMINYVKEFLLLNDGDKKNKPFQSFRSRYRHTQRVLKWCERLRLECDDNVNEHILYVSAIFHDIGYANISEVDTSLPHAEKSARYFNDYCKVNNISFALEIENNIRFHSNKELLKSEDISIELKILMEADLLDETGALSILFDCMSAGERGLDKYEDAYERICKYSCRILNKNPMVTVGGIRIWKEKQELLKNFVDRKSVV